MLFPPDGHACGSSGDYSECPVTRALRLRLNRHPIRYGEQLCRCTKPYGDRTFTVSSTSDGAVVAVTLAIEQAIQRLDVTMDRSSGIWLAADVTCAGRGTSTSIFSDAGSLCYVPSGT